MEQSNKQKYYSKYYLKNKERIAMLNKRRYNERRSTEEGLTLHRNKSTEATRRFRIKHPDRIKQTRRSVYLNRKNKAMELIGGAKCVRCGCDFIDFLEFNHINGGGCKEWRENKKGLVDRLLSGERSINGLEVLCRVCNALEYLERKDIDNAKCFNVEFRKRYAKFINSEDWESVTPKI